MIEFSPGIMVVVVGAIGICVLAMLHVLSSVMKHEVTLHDLRNRVEKLHNDYALRLARMNGDIPHESDVEIVEDEHHDTALATPAAPAEPTGAIAEPAQAA